MSMCADLYSVQTQPAHEEIVEKKRGGQAVK